jgi:hypothetical protein
MKLPPLDTHDGRRALSFLAIFGGCIVFTVFAAVGVWLVSGNALYSLYLALAAHVQILVGMTALGWAMGRRIQAEAGRDGVKINDSGGEPITSGDQVTVVKE